MYYQALVIMTIKTNRMKILKLTFVLILISSITYSQTITVNPKRIDGFKHLIDSIISNSLTDNFEYKGKTVIIRESPKYKRPKIGMLMEVIYDKMYAFYSTGKEIHVKLEFFNEKKSYNGKMIKLDDKRYANSNYYIEQVTDNEKLFYIKCENQKNEYEVQKSTFILSGDKGVKLQVEIEYTLNELGCMNNNCKAQYIVTNIGKVAYKWGETNKNKIAFEFITTDGKIIEESEMFYQNLEPGRTAPVKDVSINAGMKRICKSLKAVRMED